MIEPLFVDTGGWVALLFTRDNLHQRASSHLAQARRQRRRLLTTSAVLLETVDGFAQHNLRHLAALLKRTLQDSQAVEIVIVDERLLSLGWELYEAREDKRWSLTDCLSFIVMQERNLMDALAYDHHFQQAGFRPLLREEIAL